MNKKILEIPLYIKVAVRVTALAILLAFDLTQLSPIVLISSVIMVASGALSLVMGAVKKPAVKFYNNFLALESILVIFNLAYLAFFTSVSVSIVDTLVVGSLFDLVVNITLLAYGVKQHKYALIEESDVKLSEKEKLSSVKIPKFRGVQKLQIR